MDGLTVVLQVVLSCNAQLLLDVWATIVAEATVIYATEAVDEPLVEQTVWYSMLQDGFTEHALSVLPHHSAWLALNVRVL